MRIECHPIHFQVDTYTLRGDLYRPAGAAGLPCVVLANGFSGTKDWILPRFAERFAAAGLAVLAFDYRHLGTSDGEPRQLVDLRRQRVDLRAAIAFARTQPGLDAERIALWGTSLGGSHVAIVASEDTRLAAVVLNAPGLDVVAGANLDAKRKHLGVSRWMVLRTTLKLLAVAVADEAGAAAGRPPRYLQVYGRAGEAFFTDPALAPNFERLQAGSATWQNRVAARFLLHAPRYREGTMERIAAPMLVCLAEHDDEVSAEFVTSKARLAKRAEVRLYPCGHFDLYHGAPFEQVAHDQAQFLRRHLLG